MDSSYKRYIIIILSILFCAVFLWAADNWGADASTLNPGTTIFEYGDAAGPGGWSDNFNAWAKSTEEDIILLQSSTAGVLANTVDVNAIATTTLTVRGTSSFTGTAVISNGDINGGSASVSRLSATTVFNSNGTANIDTLDVDGASDFATTVNLSGNNVFTSAGVFSYGAIDATFAAGDLTPSVASGNIFATSSTGTAYTITALDDTVAGSMYIIIANNSNSDFADTASGTLVIAGDWTPGSLDAIIIFCWSAGNCVELTRSDN